MNIDTDAKPYQIAGAKFLASHERAILSDAPGLGKTLQTLIALDYSDIGPLDNILVIAPLSVLPGWQKDAIKWTEWRRFTIYRRKDTLPKNPGHALVPWTDLVVMRDKLLQIDWKVIVVDEAHRLKQMASDGQPGWGEVVRDLIGPPAPLDTLYPPVRLFAHTNTTESKTPVRKENQMNPQDSKSPTSSPGVADAMRAVAAAFVTLAQRMEEVESAVNSMWKDATQDASKTVTAPAVTAAQVSAEVKVETKPELKVEVKSDVPASVQPPVATTKAVIKPIPHDVFLPRQVQYLGDRVSDQAGYMARRDKIVAGIKQVSGKSDAKIASLTDEQRGELAALLGISA